MRFLLTGGPGAGKTTVLHRLHELGYAGVPEVAREIVGSPGTELEFAL